jgi:N-acetylmuramoyl-L-alanine amidase
VTLGISGPHQARWRWPIAVALAGLTLLAACLPSVGQPLPSPLLDEKIPVIVLDPGRGGASNVGGHGPTGLLEKDITLQLATEAGRLIEDLLGARVVLTRSDDSDVPLEARAALANQVGGELFISIYAGGGLGRGPREFQVFYFDDLQEKSPVQREPVSERELAGGGGLRRRGVVAASPSILWDQAQLEFLDSSQMFARLLDKNLRSQVAEEGRGVFGLPILLLRWVRMPAVLLDLGALSDPGFEAKLRDDAYLQRAALGIVQAVNDYQTFRR